MFDYEKNANKYKNMRESEVQRDLQKHMNIDFGSGEKEPSSESGDDDQFGNLEVNSGNLGDQLNDYEYDEKLKAVNENRKQSDADFIDIPRDSMTSQPDG